MKNFVITIGRQYGSGGREIGEAVARRLGLSFYDKELITASVKESGMDASVFEEMEERATPSFLFSLAVGSLSTTLYPDHMGALSLNDRVNAVQAETIRKIAAKESCVIVGRAADDLLKGEADLLNVFVHAPMPFRVQHVIDNYNVGTDPEEIEDRIEKTDKRRANYYNYVTGKKWADVRNFHLTIDSERIGFDAAVDMICRLAGLMRPELAGK